MSPEYAYEGSFSVKSDVFSFGIVVLETISGRRNSKLFQLEHCLNLQGYVSICLQIEQLSSLGWWSISVWIGSEQVNGLFGPDVTHVRSSFSNGEMQDLIMQGQIE